MGVKFLSDDHMAAATAALNANDAFVNSIANINMGLQFHVNEGPSGDIDFYLSVADGSAEMEKGELDGADVSISSDFETATALFNGELNTQMAFMTGKIKVDGNLAKLMTQQAALGHWASAVAGLDVEY